MVKLAQHIEWSSPIPSKAGEGATSIEKRRSDRVLVDGRPRKTLAQLFDSRAASQSSTSPRSSVPQTSSLSATAETAATPPSVRTTLSFSTASSASSSTTSSATTTTPPQVKDTSSASSSTPLRQLARPPLSSSTHAHVTFVENRTVKNHQHHSPAAHQSSELAGGIKRGSSVRKNADSSRREGDFLRSNNALKRLSISGPLERSQSSPRTPSTNASKGNHSHESHSAKPMIQRNERPMDNSLKKMLFGQEKVHLPSAIASLSKLEQRTRSPFAKFRIYEHNQITFLQKSIDTVESLQNGSRFRPKEPDRSLDKGLNAVYTVHNALKKEKKVRKGLFGLLTDASMGKDVVGESKVVDASTWKASGNLEKPSNTQCAGGMVQDLKSPPPRSPGNGVVQTNDNVVSLQNDQYPDRETPVNLGMLDESGNPMYMAVEIPDKMVGLAWISAEPRLLTPGSHYFPSDKFLLEQVVSDRTRYLKHGILHRVYIDEGHLGVAWVDGKAIMLEAGVSVHMSPSNKFSYKMTDEKMLAEKEFVLGPFRVVTVDESEVGIKFHNRLPQVLYVGRHCLSISNVEVFAGFESILRRQSYLEEASALSRDNMKVSADVCVEWQIKAEDAAAARLANVTDVEGAVCCKVRRAFNLVIWEINACDMELQLTTNVDSMNHPDLLPLLKSLSSNVLRECQELFEEGWTVTIWDLQLKHIVIQPEVQGNNLT